MLASEIYLLPPSLPHLLSDARYSHINCTADWIIAHFLSFACAVVLCIAVQWEGQWSAGHVGPAAVWTLPSGLVRRGHGPACAVSVRPTHPFLMLWHSARSPRATASGLVCFVPGVMLFWRVLQPALTLRVYTSPSSFQPSRQSRAGNPTKRS